MYAVVLELLADVLRIRLADGQAGIEARDWAAVVVGS